MYHSYNIIGYCLDTTGCYWIFLDAIEYYEKLTDILKYEKSP